MSSRLGIVLGVSERGDGGRMMIGIGTKGGMPNEEGKIGFRRRRLVCVPLEVALFSWICLSCASVRVCMCVCVVVGFVHDGSRCWCPLRARAFFFFHFFYCLFITISFLFFVCVCFTMDAVSFGILFQTKASPKGYFVVCTLFLSLSSLFFRSCVCGWHEKTKKNNCLSMGWKMEGN